MVAVLRRVYLDCAANTPLLPEVHKAMQSAFSLVGNPSAIHHEGRQLKNALEQARRQMADILNVLPSELSITSGGTEANNWALKGAVEQLGVRHLISSPIEHESILRPMEWLNKKGIVCTYLPVDTKGVLDMDALAKTLSDAQAHKQKCLVSLMHANNEIGNINDLLAISALCRRYEALIHSDAVQSMGSGSMAPFFQELDMITASAHKFHGPLGVGFLYVRQGVPLTAQLLGGPQERGMRAGTENIPGILGMAAALDIVYPNAPKHQQYLRKLKKYTIQQLQTHCTGMVFNGQSDQIEQSLPSLLSLRLPSVYLASDVPIQLDMKGIAISAGSACHSGAPTHSHVLRAIQAPLTQAHIRCSFSHLNTQSDMDYFVQQLASLGRGVGRRAQAARFDA